MQNYTCEICGIYNCDTTCEHIRAALANEPDLIGTNLIVRNSPDHNVIELTDSLRDQGDPINSRECDILALIIHLLETQTARPDIAINLRDHDRYSSADNTQTSVQFTVDQAGYAPFTISIAVSDLN